MNILDTMQWRYATKRMTNQKVTEKQLDTILEAIRLSPSAYGLQPYTLLVTKDNKLITDIYQRACPQPVVKQCSHLLIFKTLKKITPNYIDNYLKQLQVIRNLSDNDRQAYQSKIDKVLFASNFNHFEWAKHQTYIALGVGLIAAASLDIDATPIEGFDPTALNHILDLDTHIEETTLMMAIGYRDTQEDTLIGLPKVRKSMEELIQRR